MGIGRFLHRARWDAERARELDAYLAEEIADNLARGLTPDEARTAAYRKLGNPTRIREEIYTMNSLGLVEALWQDLRYGARLLIRNPVFAIVAILTLALGTGANTAMFQLVDAVRLRSLPVDHPEQLADVRVASAHGKTGMFNGRYPMLSYPLYLKIREQQQVFTGLAAWGTTTFDLAQGGEERPAQALWVSGNFFPLLGVHPATGRLLAPEDDVKGCAPAAVLGHAFWQREFGGDPAIAGRTMLLDGQRVDIVGVAPAAFSGVEVGRSFDLAVPICAQAAMRPGGSVLERGDVWFISALGRLKPGLTVERAGAQLAAVSKPILTATVPASYSAQDAADYLRMSLGASAAATGWSGLRRDYGESLNLLLGVTALVLLIACANLANLMLARATARQREFAVRLAIGASRGRIVRQMLSESLLIAVIGAGGGVLLAQWFSRALVAFLGSADSPLFVDLGLDWRLFAFTAAVAAAACLLFGLTPAIRATRASPGPMVKTGRGMTDSRERFGLRRALVILQVALSLVLVFGALLFARSLRKLTTIDGGFQPDGVVTARLDLRKANVAPDARLALRLRLLDDLRAIPGVHAAGEAFTTPVGGNFWNNRVLIDGVLHDQFVNFNAVSPGYFGALGIGIAAGRDFDARDTPQSPKVAVVSESFAKKYFPGRDPIGRSFEVEAAPGAKRDGYQIVGVVKDTKYSDLREPFLPLAHVASTQDQGGRFVQFVIRSDVDAAALTSATTRAIGRISPAISIQYQTVKMQVRQSLLRERLMATLSGFFGGLAALIATIGLYGVMSYMVTRRRTEIGVRMALGADAGRVVRMIVREAGVLLAAGLAIGVVLAVVAARSASSLLYELQPWDPVTIALAAAGLASVTMLAGWVPAHRASRLPPTVALRED
jgi:predicted permease